jgi:hypothetical protein
MEEQPQHTPGLLHVVWNAGEEVADGGCMGIYDERGASVVITDSGLYPPTAGDARRLVACWNACAGLDTAALESGALRQSIDALPSKTAAWVSADLRDALYRLEGK